MRNSRIREVWPRYLLVAVLGLALSLVNGSSPQAQRDGILALQAPPFLGDNNVTEVDALSFPEGEAGISAYFKASTTIDLNKVRWLFRTIEVDTANYVIGSIPVAGYDEPFDVHVYVHVDGWIVAYYLNWDPAAKIFDWHMYHNTGRTNIRTKLENTVSVVADAAAVPFSGVTYYDFRYPNATHLMLVVEWVFGSTDSCDVYLPASFAFYERSWSLRTSSGTARYYLDSTEIANTTAEWHGALTSNQLPSGQWHAIGVFGYNYAYAGLALIYRVP